MMKKFALPSVLSALLLLLSACGGGAPEPGSWVVPDEYNDSYERYGRHWIFFGVSTDSSAISSLNLMIPYNWSCDGMTITYDHLLFIDAETGAYDVSDILPTRVSGTLAPIEDGAFHVVLNAYVFEGSIFDLQAATFIFDGRFTSSKKASGTWELDLPSSGKNCTGTWYGFPNPAGED